MVPLTGHPVYPTLKETHPLHTPVYTLVGGCMQHYTCTHVGALKCRYWKNIILHQLRGGEVCGGFPLKDTTAPVHYTTAVKVCSTTW